MSPPRLVLSNLNGFPQEFHETGKILTIAFIEASNEVITIIEMFGTLFSPVVKDMRGNVNQLLAHYYEDESSRRFIEDMVLSDENRATHTWLLWLKRALELVERFFWHILSDTEVITEKKDNLTPHLGKAYDEILKPYHGFFLRNTFRVMYHYMPSRSSLFGTGNHFDDNMKHLKILQPKMQRHVDKINRLYKDNNLNYQEKV